MCIILQDLWSDEGGFIVSIELILVATILVLGLIVGMSCLASAVVAEFQDLGFATRALNQSYYFGGFRGCKSFVPGSSYVNRPFFNNMPLGANTWDLGYGLGPNTGYGVTAAPTYVAPAVIVPKATVTCPTGNCDTNKVVPCPNGTDCVNPGVAPGTPLVPAPEGAAEIHTAASSQPAAATPVVTITVRAAD